MFERFTERARETVARAQIDARTLRHDWVGTEHLLLGLVAQRDSVGGLVLESFTITRDAVMDDIQRIIGSGSTLSDADALAAIGIDLDEVRRRVEQAFGPGALERTLARGCRRGSAFSHLPFTPRAKKALELALREALKLKHNYIGTEHILLALLHEGEGVAAQVLITRGVTYRDARAAILSRLQDAAG